MGRILKQLPQNAEALGLKEFNSSVEKGKKAYEMRSFSFDEETSVQDSRCFEGTSINEPVTVENRVDEITDADYLPPSKLAKADKGVVGDKVTMPKSNATGEFVESPEFCDVEEEQKDYPGKIVRSSEHELVAEGQASAFDAEKEAMESKIADLMSKLQEKEEEISRLKDELPKLIENAKLEAKAEGFAEGEAASAKAYEAQKEDYLSKLEIFNQEALSKLDEINKTIKSIDDEVSETVLGFLKSIIGAERRINDKFVVGLIKANLDKLKELKIVSFHVNPGDVEVMKSFFNNYPVEADPNINKGAVRIISKTGEVDLSAENMVTQLEKQINEIIDKTKKS